MEIQVKVTKFLEEQRGQGRNGEWVRNAFVAETINTDYPKTVKFDVFGAERWEKMKQYLFVGGNVRVSFDIESKEFNGKYYTSLMAFSAYAGVGDGTQGGGSIPAPTQTQEVPAPAPIPQPQAPAAPAREENSDDLPF